MLNIKMSDLLAAKKQSGEISQKRDEDLKQVYREGLQYFRTFVVSNGDDKNSLKQAVAKLNEAISIKKHNAGPYFYLSYIFYICGEKSKAIKYMKIVKLIEPEYEGLSKLEKKLLGI
jgi:tetratricopeptide (TPR) repeat protein